MSLKTGQNTKAEYKVDAYKALTDAEGLRGLQLLTEFTEHEVFECKNKYHFLDRFIDFQQKRSLRTITCSDVKLKRFLDSCGIAYQDKSEGAQEMDLNSCDYWEPNGTVASFDYSRADANPAQSGGQEILVAFRDQMVKSTEVLFERLKNRLRDTDLKRVKLYSLDPTLRRKGVDLDKKIILFVINQRL